MSHLRAICGQFFAASFAFVLLGSVPATAVETPAARLYRAITDVCLDRYLSDIPLRLENPKIGGVDDAEIVGDRIAEDCPFFRYLLAQEMQNRSAELVVGRVAAVVGYVPMHQSP